MSDAPVADKRLLRRRFERVAGRYDQAAVLAREIGARMQERLDLLKLQPQRALDLGSGTGHGARALRARYRQCLVVELDLTSAMLRVARAKIAWWQRGIGRLRGERTPQVCGDMERLPFADALFDMVWSNFALQWAGSPQRAFAEMHRVLRPGGVCLFSTLGPDTLKELRSAAAQAGGDVTVHPMIDLHDYGDMLVQARFADPVMDMEYLTLTYGDVDSLLRELKTAGAGNLDPGRRQGLMGKDRFERLRRAYEDKRRDGRIPATFEIVYGHAWRPESARTAADGRAVVQFHRSVSGGRNENPLG
jgi:malonyl-CoA O-methyltransferase